MSEEHPVYVRCASGSNSHTDCCIRRHGDCVEILGHPLMHIAPDDAVHFATAMLRAADKTGYRGRDMQASELCSKIAMTLHIPIIPDSLARELLNDTQNTLRFMDHQVNYWMRIAEQWRGLYDREAALKDAEMDDNK